MPQGELVMGGWWQGTGVRDILRVAKLKAEAGSCDGTKGTSWRFRCFLA